MRVPGLVPLCVLAVALAGCAGGRGLSYRPETVTTAYGNLRWPVAGVVSSGFGGRDGRRHNGVDILAPEGTEVRAAGTGRVLYAGEGLRGYGNAAVLDHGEGITTLYGHLKEIRVKSGDGVTTDAVIGTVGRTGNATTSHLHFELRLEGRSVDPEKYMRRMDGTQWKR